MNRVILIDDRVERIKRHLSEIAIGRLKEECKDFLVMCAEAPTEYQSLSMFLSDYSMVIIHRSWLAENGLVNSIREITKDKCLIIFSGGITQNLFSDRLRCLQVNSSIFYSEHLPDFLKKYSRGESCYPLIELIYGEAWKLPLLIQLRNLMWVDETEKENMLEEEEDEEQSEKYIFYNEYKEALSLPNYSELTIDSLNAEIDKEEIKYF